MVKPHSNKLNKIFIIFIALTISTTLKSQGVDPNVFGEDKDLFLCVVAYSHRVRTTKYNPMEVIKKSGVQFDDVNQAMSKFLYSGFIQCREEIRNLDEPTKLEMFKKMSQNQFEDVLDYVNFDESLLRYGGQTELTGEELDVKSKLEQISKKASESQPDMKEMQDKTQELQKKLEERMKSLESSKGAHYMVLGGGVLIILIFTIGSYCCIKSVSEPKDFSKALKKFEKEIQMIEKEKKNLKKEREQLMKEKEEFEKYREGFNKNNEESKKER